MNLKRNAATLAAAAIVGALGIGGLMSAHADSPTSHPSKVSTQQAGDGETSDDATDTGPDANPNEPGHQDASDNQGGDGEINDDATDTGPDANPNEPGHQDASDNESEGAGDTDGSDAAEAGEAETNDDATDTGPDADPNEPGHQDASDK